MPDTRETDAMSESTETTSTDAVDAAITEQTTAPAPAANVKRPTVPDTLPAEWLAMQDDPEVPSKVKRSLRRIPPLLAAIVEAAKDVLRFIPNAEGIASLWDAECTPTGRFAEQYATITANDTRAAELRAEATKLDNASKALKDEGIATLTSEATGDPEAADAAREDYSVAVETLGSIDGVMGALELKGPQWKAFKREIPTLLQLTTGKRMPHKASTGADGNADPYDGWRPTFRAGSVQVKSGEDGTWTDVEGTTVTELDKSLKLGQKNIRARMYDAGGRFGSERDGQTIEFGPFTVNNVPVYVRGIAESKAAKVAAAKLDSDGDSADTVTSPAPVTDAPTFQAPEQDSNDSDALDI